MAKKVKSKFTVIRSGQEKRNFWDFSPDEHCHGTYTGPIKTGDYSLRELPDKVFTIERKYSVGEIYNNLFEKRFTRELERLVEFKYKYIVCQFELKDVLNFPYNSGIPSRFWDGLKANGAFILSRLTGITTRMNIPVIFAGPGESSKALALYYMKHVARLEGLI